MVAAPIPLQPNVRLSEEQKALVAGAHGLAEKIARGVARSHRLAQPFGDLLSHAHYGIVIAASTWDSERGPFEPWARRVASGKVIDGARKDRREWTMIRRGRRAALAYLHGEREVAAFDPFGETDDLHQAELDQKAQGILGAFVAKLAAPAGDEGGASSPEEQLVAEHVAQTLRDALVELDDDARIIVALCFAGSAADPDDTRDATLRAIAEQLGMSMKTLIRRRDRARETIGARLAASGITEMPRWTDGASGGVLEHMAQEAWAALENRCRGGHERAVGGTK